MVDEGNIRQCGMVASGPRIGRKDKSDYLIQECGCWLIQNTAVHTERNLINGNST